MMEINYQSKWANYLAIQSQILSFRYFSWSLIDCNPYNAWRSIWTTRLLLRDGCKWSIQSGSDISVWK